MLTVRVVPKIRIIWQILPDQNLFPGRLFLDSYSRIGLEYKTTDSGTGRGVMLVLSRKLGEKIHIGEKICITIVDIDRGKIRLGIEAPREVPIFRQELLTGNPTNTEGPEEIPVSQ
jgi:carbon storage regulator